MVSDQNKEEIKKRWCRLKTRNIWGRRRTREEDDGNVLPEEEEERKKRKERKGKNNEMSGPPFSIIREGITKFMKLPTYPYIKI